MTNTQTNIQKLNSEYIRVFELGRRWVFFYNGELQRVMGILYNSKDFEDCILYVPLSIRDYTIYQPHRLETSDTEFDRIATDLLHQFYVYSTGTPENVIEERKRLGR